jgi:hypothetical protein
MKRKAAFAAEEDPETGEAVLGTESSASFFLSPEQSRERRKSWRRSGSDFVRDSESFHLGSALDVIRQSKNEETLLTIIAGEHDDNAEVWKECKNSGTKFRLFALKGRNTAETQSGAARADLEVRYRNQWRGKNICCARDFALEGRGRP